MKRRNKKPQKILENAIFLIGLAFAFYYYIEWLTADVKVRM